MQVIGSDGQETDVVPMARFPTFYSPPSSRDVNCTGNAQHNNNQVTHREHGDRAVCAANIFLGRSAGSTGSGDESCR